MRAPNVANPLRECELATAPSGVSKSSERRPPPPTFIGELAVAELHVSRAARFLRVRCRDRRVTFPDAP